MDTVNADGPSVYYVDEAGEKVRVFPAKLTCFVEVHLTTAVATYEAEFSPLDLPKEACDALVFELPLIDEHATVTGATAVKSDKFFETMVVDRKAAIDAPKDTQAAAAAEKLSSDGGLNLTEYDPQAFRFPLAGLPEAGPLQVCVEEIGALRFDSGSYELGLPLRSHNPDTKLQIQCTLNTGLGACVWTCKTHPVNPVSSGDGRAVLVLEAGAGDPRNNFIVSYAAWDEAPRASVIVEEDADKGGGNFALFLAPPSVTAVAQSIIGRSVVFLLDVSGSMGSVIEDAKRAMVTAVQSLGPSDSFALCAFSHEQLWLCDEGNDLQWFSASDVGRAVDWVSTLRAGGGTNIMDPMRIALDNLRAKRHDVPGGELPVVIMVTDGAVANERDIVNFVKANNDEGNNGGNPAARIFTFGIGPFCNRYFLQMLATYGKGYSDFYLSDDLHKKMSHLLMMSANPVLTMLSFQVGGRDVEMYPDPLPDLYCGAPLVITGRHSGGGFPSQVQITGTDASGAKAVVVANASIRERVPVKKMCVKAKLDHLIGLHWLTDSAQERAKLTKEIVALSVSESIPTPFTAPVIYHVGPPPPPVASMERPDKPDSFGPGPPPPRHRRLSDAEKASEADKAKKKKGGLSPAATAGVFVLGTAAVGAIAFGSIAATSGNVDFGALDGVFSSISFDGMPAPDITNCPDCGVCSCLDASIWSGCSGAAEGCWDFVAGAVPCCGDVASGVGDCCTSVTDLLGGCFGDIGGACCVVPEFISGALADNGPVCESCFGTLANGCGAAATGCGEVCGPLLSGCGEFAGTAATGCGEVCGPLLSGCGEFAGTAATGCGDLLSNVPELLGQCGTACGECGGQLFTALQFLFDNLSSVANNL